MRINMGRFLIFFSYIGTAYNGLQRQIVSGIPKEGTYTIQGALEEALSALKPRDEVKLVTSSRTDAGVHGLSNSAHFDLIHSDPQKDFSPLVITAVTNQFLFKRRHDIRVIRTLRVADDFHCRFLAISRHYIYRLSVIKKSVPLHWAIPSSAFEERKSVMVYPPFDVNRLHDAARAFVGLHDFSAYTNPSVLEQTHLNPVKKVSVGVKKGHMIFSPYQEVVNQYLEPWEIHVSSHSFLYKQVRRMVGVMLKCAKGEITCDDIKKSLESPDQGTSNFVQSRAAPAYGLYMKNVEYHPSAFDEDEGSEDSLLQDFSILQTDKYSKARFKKLIKVVKKKRKNVIHDETPSKIADKYSVIMEEKNVEEFTTEYRAKNFEIESEEKRKESSRQFNILEDCERNVESVSHLDNNSGEYSIHNEVNLKNDFYKSDNGPTNQSAVEEMDELTSQKISMHSMTSEEENSSSESPDNNMSTLASIEE